MIYYVHHSPEGERCSILANDNSTEHIVVGFVTAVPFATRAAETNSTQLGRIGKEKPIVHIATMCAAIAALQKNINKGSDFTLRFIANPAINARQ